MVALQHEIRPKYKIILLFFHCCICEKVKWKKTRYWRWRGLLCPLKFKRAFEKVIFGERWHTQSSTWSNLWKASTQTGGKCQFSQNWKINVTDQESALRLPFSSFSYFSESSFIKYPPPSIHPISIISLSKLIFLTTFQKITLLPSHCSLYLAGGDALKHNEPWTIGKWESQSYTDDPRRRLVDIKPL